MDQVTLAKSEFRAKQWASIIKECQNSGQTIVSWCEEHQVSIKSYYYWLRKLRLRELESTELTVPQASKKPVTFKKLAVTASLPNVQAAVIIRLPNATLEINEGASQQTIQAVLLALQSVC